MTILVGLLGLHLVGALSAGHAVNFDAGRERRRVIVLSLLLVPYLALPLYWLCGYGATASSPKRWRKNEEEMEHLTDLVTEKLSEHRAGDSPARASLANLTPFPVTQGNKIELLINGEEAFPAYIQAIVEARSYILCQFYLIREDETARKFLEHLIDARTRGVEVYIYYDPLESRPAEEFWAPAVRAGIEIAEHRPARHSRNALHVDYRNHRKIFVVDGRVAIMGGLNLGDEYLSKVPEMAPWRDTCLKLTGPAVLGAQWSFLRDFSWATGSHPVVEWERFERQVGDAEAVVLATGPYDQRPACCLCFLEAFAQAKRRIWLTTPFLSPEESGLMALELALARGVEVRVIVPGATEVSVAELIAWAFFRRLLPLGVQFYQSKEGSMHQKVVLIDDHLTLLGSANFDYRSFRMNHENILWVESVEVAGRVEKMLETDMEAYEQLDVDKLSRRTRWDWYKTSAARVLDMVLGG